MFCRRPNFTSSWMLAIIVVLASVSIAQAGWMGLRNDTKAPIIVQETITANGQVKLGRPQQILAGEVIRDTQGAGGQRIYGIYDAKNPAQPIYSGRFSCPPANENYLHVIKSDGQGGISIETIKTPVQAVPPKKK